jgi:hypothetical protein
VPVRTAAEVRARAAAARCATDPETLARVAEALHGQLDGQVIPAMPPLIGPAGALAQRTGTPVPAADVSQPAGSMW